MSCLDFVGALLRGCSPVAKQWGHLRRPCSPWNGLCVGSFAIFIEGVLEKKGYWVANSSCAKTGVDKWSNSETLLGLFSSFCRACLNTSFKVDQKVSPVWSKHTDITGAVLCSRICYWPGRKKVFGEHIPCVFDFLWNQSSDTSYPCGDKLIERLIIPVK